MIDYMDLRWLETTWYLKLSIDARRTDLGIYASGTPTDVFLFFLVVAWLALAVCDVTRPAGAYRLLCGG